MTIAKRPFVLLLAVSVILCGAAAFLPGASGIPTRNAVSASSTTSNADVTGTWSGTFQSRQPHFSPFTITVVIRVDESGHLVGASSVSSDCLKDGTLQVTVKGSNVTLAGGDEEGNHITFTGTIDKTGTLMNLRYVLNSSASARCESDDGSGNMGKR
jgi:hypothetical protein